MKRYLTYKRKKINNNYYQDPNTNWLFQEATEWAVFYETPYQLSNKVFVAWVEYPDTTTQAQIDWLISTYNQFEFTFIDEATANTLLSELTDDTGSVTVTDFIFTDKRVFDLI